MAFIQGVVVGSVSLMSGVTFRLTQSSLLDIATLALFIAAFGLLFVPRCNSACLIIAGGAIGFLLKHH